MKGKQSKFAASGSFFLNFLSFLNELIRAGRWRRCSAVLTEHLQLKTRESIHMIRFLITCQRRGLKMVSLATGSKLESNEKIGCCDCFFFK